MRRHIAVVAGGSAAGVADVGFEFAFAGAVAEVRP
jgi:hypothetical protein